MQSRNMVSRTPGTDMSDKRPKNTAKWGPPEWKRHGGPLVGWLLFVASILFAADYAVRGAESLLSSVGRLCETHKAVCFWEPTRDCSSLPLEEYLKCNP